MHPILASGRRLLVYLAAWIPVLMLITVVTRQSVAVLAPACLLYAFVSLSPWYVCRALPFQVSKAAGLAVTHAATALAGGGMLVGTAAGLAALVQVPSPNWELLFAMGAMLYLLSVGLHYAAISSEASREAERRAAEARTLAREAELLSLRIQLNPHFLFNCLHSISALAVQDGPRAREMCVRLADFLRSSMSLGKRESIPLREELALARSYLDVERVRFGERLRLEEEIDETCEGCAIPALLLQPLVENAVKHGIAGLVDGGWIRLLARRTADAIAITIENALDPETASGPNLGTGQAHVRRRLQVRYGGAASLESGGDSGVYRIVLRFPCESPIASISRA